MERKCEIPVKKGNSIKHKRTWPLDASVTINFRLRESLRTYPLI
nr:MAG TPA: hypothetical protein [Caudoviricetes sp.]